jgi:hypothetical protein
MIRRVFYAAGPGDVVGAHQHWAHHERDPGEVAITYSSLVEGLCQELDATAYIVSSHHRKGLVVDGRFTLENRPKPMPGARGARYHLREILYALGLLLTAVRFWADVAVCHSGTTHFFALTLFRLFGIPVVPVLHNTLWPTGFPPRRWVRRLIRWLDARFWRWGPSATLCVSPECARQVEALTRGRHAPLFQFRAQYDRELNRPIPPPPYDDRPFRLVYFGPIDEWHVVVLQVVFRKWDRQIAVAWL